MSYAHTNTRGVTYYLNNKQVTLRGNKQFTIFYFSKDERKATACEMPVGYVVAENPRNGFLALKKA